MQTPIYVIGSANTDMVIKSDRLPSPGETVIGGTFLMNPGGKGANQAVAAARLGGNVTFVAKVGNDLFGRQTLQQLGDEKIDTQFVSIDTSLPSGVALINVDAMGENCIAVAPGANGNLSETVLIPVIESMPSSSLVLVQLEIPVASVEYLIHACAQRNVPVILNPAPAVPFNAEILRHVRTITPNETEAEKLTGIKVTDESSARAAASRLHDLGVSQVVLTLGEKGAYWSMMESSGFVPAPSVSAVDTTAAGDCFSGALAVALAEERSLRDAVTFACRAASIAVTRMGAQASMPTRREVDDLSPFT